MITCTTKLPSKMESILLLSFAPALSVSTVQFGKRALSIVNHSRSILLEMNSNERVALCDAFIRLHFSTFKFTFEERRLETRPISALKSNLR